MLKKNDDANILYFLLDGLISINVSDINGNTSRVQTLMKGSLIGERSFITEQKHSADAVAESPATVIALDKAAYLNLKISNPDAIDKLNHHIIKTLSERLLSADQLISLLMLY